MKSAILVVMLLAIVCYAQDEQVKTDSHIDAKQTPKWCNPKYWRKPLKTGLRETQVIAILGEPKYIERHSHRTILYYHTKPCIKSEKKGRHIAWPEFGYVILSSKDSDGIRGETVRRQRPERGNRQRGGRAPRSGRGGGGQRGLDIKTKKRKIAKLTKPDLRTLEWVEPNWNQLGDISNMSFLVEQAKKPIRSLVKWQDSKSWRKLRLNLTERQARKILGEPTRVQKGVRGHQIGALKQRGGPNERGRGGDRVHYSTGDSTNKKIQFWKYGASIAAGSLGFTFDDDILGYRLSSWSEPFWPEVEKALHDKNKSKDTATNAGVSYSIINSDTFLDYKRSLDIRLNKKVSEKTLRAIALKLKAQDSRNYERTFICYYLPDMEVGAGAWATTHFNPNLEVRIQAALDKQQRPPETVKVEPEGESTIIEVRKPAAQALKKINFGAKAGLEIWELAIEDKYIRTGPGMKYKNDDTGPLSAYEKLYILKEKDGWLCFRITEKDLGWSAWIKKELTEFVSKSPLNDDDKIHQMLADGLIHSVNVEYNTVRIDPLIWNTLPIETKQGIVMFFSKYFNSKGNSARVEILSNRNDTKLATYGAWGGIKILK